MEQTSITVTATINAPVTKVWECYTKPEHITKWNSASPDWHTPKAENDLRVGGKFLSRMEPIGKSEEGFDFTGTYTAVEELRLIGYKMDDGREAEITFAEHEGKTEVSVTFDAETENSIELQRSGWQAILDNFKKYVESV